MVELNWILWLVKVGLEGRCEFNLAKICVDEDGENVVMIAVWVKLWVVVFCVCSFRQ